MKPNKQCKIAIYTIKGLSVSMRASVCSVEGGHTVWHPELKFHTEALSHKQVAHTKFQSCTGPHPWGLGPWIWGHEFCTALTQCFFGIYITQKLLGTSKMEGQIRPDQVPDLTQVSSGRSNANGLLQPWTLGHLGWNLVGRWAPTIGLDNLTTKIRGP